jgi:hypothetical protein
VAFGQTRPAPARTTREGRAPRAVPRALLVVLCAAGALGGGCRGGSPKVSFAPPDHTIVENEYERLLERWTRRASVLKIKELDTTLKVNATCFSPEFEAVYVARTAHIFRYPSAERGALTARLRKDDETSLTFFMAAATTDTRWNDFDRKESVWRVALANDRGEEVTPLSVTLERVNTATITELFPYVESFYNAYRLRFPRTFPDGRPLITDETQRITLRIAGPLGVAELVWRFR